MKNKLMNEEAKLKHKNKISASTPEFGKFDFENEHISFIKSKQKKDNLFSAYHFSVCKIENEIATLISEDLTLIEMPLNVLPDDVRKGNILKITVERNIEQEEKRRDDITNIQKNLIENENLFLKNVRNV